MSEINDIEALERLNQLLQIMGKISRISYLADQAKQRYPAPEAMSTAEITALSKMYLSLGKSFEDAFSEWTAYKKKVLGKNSS
jgi:hypothetical protein